MNARRLAVLTPVMWILLIGLAAAQEPEPAVPPEQPPVAGAQPSLPELPPSPSQFSPLPRPGVPDTGFPPTAPTVPPNLPNLLAPPPGEIEGRIPRIQQSDNPLLKLFDTDGDGVLSGDEVEDAPAQLWGLDRNLDAQLSLDELGLVLAPRWEERRRGIRGILPVEPMQAQPKPPVVPERPLVEERPRIEVYPLRGLDPGRTLSALQQLLQGEPEVRLTFDARTQSILALAGSNAHTKIRDSLANLLEGERTGIPGLAGLESPAPQEAALPVMPRVVPLYNRRAREVLRILQQVYRDRIFEPGAQPPAGDPGIPGLDLPPVMETPTVPAGKMVVGEGAEPNTIVVSAQDELFFEVLDLIEQLDDRREADGGEMAVPPEN